jgi:hypothetical protein
MDIVNGICFVWCLGWSLVGMHIVIQYRNQKAFVGGMAIVMLSAFPALVAALNLWL